MDITELTVLEMRDALKNKKLSSKEIIGAYLGKIEEVDGKLNSFITVTKEEALKAAKGIDDRISRGEDVGILAGIPVGVKDNIITKDIKTTCASKMLKDFMPPYDATVVEKIKKADGIILGKTNMDEFAAGYSTETSYFGVSKNPIDVERIPGGSSGGSAVAVRAGEIALALGSDTGGSNRIPASYCGIVGIKPTYGLVSRYGLVALANSMEQIGSIGRNVRDTTLMLEAIAGLDAKDPTTVNVGELGYLNRLEDGIKGMRFALPDEYMNMDMDKEVKEKIINAAKTFEKLGGRVEEVSLPCAEYAWMVYYLIAVSEISSNMARYDGIRYGYRAKEYETLDELYLNTRTEGFGEEIKKSIMAGTFVLSNKEGRRFYDKALKLRKLIKKDFDNVFHKYDVILTPSTPNPPPKINNKVQGSRKIHNPAIFNVPANLTGICAISIPCGYISGLPVGLQMMGDRFKELNILKAAYALETEFSGGENDEI